MLRPCNSATERTRILVNKMKSVRRLGRLGVGFAGCRMEFGNGDFLVTRVRRAVLAFYLNGAGKVGLQGRGQAGETKFLES